MHNDTAKTATAAILRYQGPSSVLEKLAADFLAAPNFKMIESRFRATDRNLTIRLRNHENHRP